MRIVFCVLSGALLSGCLATSNGMRTINSEPPGALVTVQGFGQCETPCTVRLDDHRNITVAKAGYKARRFVLGPDGGEVNVELELAAPAGDVDSTALPDLD